MIRASKLETSLYAEVKADRSALDQATMAVIISSLAAGIGTGLTDFLDLIVGVLITLAAWFLWSFLTYLAGTKLLPQRQATVDYPEFLRTIGFSSSPGVIRILGVIPGLGGIVLMAASVWMMLAMVIAVQQAADYRGILRPLAAVVIGWIAQVALLVLITEVFGLGPGA